jgi:hypothetical protein
MNLFFFTTPEPLHKEIGKRLREFRGGETMASLSRSIGVNPGPWLAYEDGRVRLPWKVFVRIWETRGLHPRWLYEGVGPNMLSRELFDLPFNPGDLPSRISFAEVYEKALEEMFSAQDGNPDAQRGQHIRQLQKFLAAAEKGRVPLATLFEVAFHAYKKSPAMKRRAHEFATRPDAAAEARD